MTFFFVTSDKDALSQPKVKLLGEREREREREREIFKVLDDISVHH